MIPLPQVSSTFKSQTAFHFTNDVMGKMFWSSPTWLSKTIVRVQFHNIFDPKKDQFAWTQRVMALLIMNPGIMNVH